MASQRSKFSSSVDNNNAAQNISFVYDDDAKRKFLTRAIENPLPREDQVTSLNCIIFGEAGSGKSSFVNTCYWSVFPELIKQQGIAYVNNTTDHVTRVVTYYKIGQHLSLIDTKGLTTFSDEKEAIKIQLGGRAVDGKEVMKSEKKTFFEWLLAKQGKVDFFDCIREGDIHTMPHCVIIVMAVTKPVPPGILTVLEIIQAQKLPIPVIFLLSKVDLEKPLDLEKWKKEMVSMFKTAFPEVESRTFEISNYPGMSDQRLDPERTSHALNILMQARTLAHAFITQKIHDAQTHKDEKNTFQHKFRLKVIHEDGSASWVGLHSEKYCKLVPERQQALIFIQTKSNFYQDIKTKYFLQGCSSTWFLHQWITCNSTYTSSWEKFYQVETAKQGLFKLKNEPSGHVYADKSGYLLANGDEQTALHFQIDFLIE
mmetsp:Transcript_27527/g.38826  ORF Transcript_27527/g.38826 Transcript_27527/m.38826 type:complete len:427 (+) Transcript_27527:84-1364(+)|eukprot:CAMPEP_0168558614 /NCGR_PEP_ID=MMETSP0413-20121227/10066_1 /TAXON_ID=136452 /ORGANISM="Filamoeba nolandi, Strain NC-AS-23-1" /LENGTH=426 /DNA_ID=CAMNT_0008589751 /DNA_START=36 /DNA_END=1316 /DNA_ORIENTATION=+